MIDNKNVICDKYYKTQIDQYAEGPVNSKI